MDDSFFSRIEDPRIGMMELREMVDIGSGNGGSRKERMFYMGEELKFKKVDVLYMVTELDKMHRDLQFSYTKRAERFLDRIFVLSKDKTLYPITRERWGNSKTSIHFDFNVEYYEKQEKHNGGGEK